MEDKSIFTNLINTIERNLVILKGEIYKLEHDKKKKAGREARNAAMNIIKVCNQLRISILDMMKALPKRVHNWSEESIKNMVKRRKSKIDSKK